MFLQKNFILMYHIGSVHNGPNLKLFSDINGFWGKSGIVVTN